MKKKINSTVLTTIVHFRAFSNQIEDATNDIFTFEIPKITTQGHPPREPPNYRRRTPSFFFFDHHDFLSGIFHDSHNQCPRPPFFSPTTSHVRYLRTGSFTTTAPRRSRTYVYGRPPVVPSPSCYSLCDSGHHRRNMFFNAIRVWNERESTMRLLFHRCEGPSWVSLIPIIRLNLVLSSTSSTTVHRQHIWTRSTHTITGPGSRRIGNPPGGGQ